MSQQLLPFLYVELAYSIIFNLIFTGLFIRQVRKLDKLSENLHATIPSRVWMKFSILLILILLEILHLILSYSNKSYWLNGYANFSLVVFLFVTNYTMQSYIVLKLVSKGSGRRYIPNIVYWFLCMLSALIEVIVVQMLIPDSQFKEVLLQLLISLLNFGILLIQIIFDKVKPQLDLGHVKSDSDQTTRNIQDSIKNWEKIKPTNRLFIEFNQHFQVNQQKEGIIFEFKIAVYIDEKSNIISKNDQDFIKLSMEMKKYFPHRHQIEISFGKKKSNILQYGEERLKYLQTYLLDLTRTGQFIVPCLLDFLEIPLQARAKLTVNQPYSMIKRQTIFSEVQEKPAKPFFHVYCSNGQFIIQNTDFERFTVTRDLQDIMQLYLKLKAQKKLTLDVLPQYPKEEDIVHFFEIVVNKKSLWRCFACWFRLDIQLENKVYNFFDPWAVGFKHLTVDIIGHQVVFDQDGKVFTCYLISLNSRGVTQMQNNFFSKLKGTVIKKRFSQFDSLDKHVRKFIDRKKIVADSLPPLPPKFSPFGSKTSPKSRQIRLGFYIKGLLKVDGINQCIPLLQFLEFDSINYIKEEEPQELSEQIEEQSQLSYFSELNQRG